MAYWNEFELIGRVGFLAGFAESGTFVLGEEVKDDEPEVRVVFGDMNFCIF